MTISYLSLSLLMPISAVPPLTILHTSDWHLGRRLYGRLRYEEFEAFLNWLTETIRAQQVDVLIVAGDIFDTMTPSNRAQALYYEFLSHVSRLCCQHIVIVAGNHDSPSFLDAPSRVLKSLNVHVIGTACEDLNDEVLVLDDTDGKPRCIIAAVPYLRDRDVRGSRAGESADSKDANVIKGIRAHYEGVATIAKNHQASFIKTHQQHIPIIATGHLFAAGSKMTEDDGVRDLYVGNLGQISAEMFDECFDYVALGHLHVPQRVGGQSHIRYSGSPIAMGFGEAQQQKQVVLIQFATVLPTQQARYDSAHDRHISALPIPCFQKLAQISGDLQTIKEAIASLPALAPDNSGSSNNSNHSETVWLEVIYTGAEMVNELRDVVATMVEGLACEVLKTKNTHTYNKVLNQQQSHETLQDLNESEVFERCLTLNDIPDSQKESLRTAYQHIVYNLHHDDKRAE